VLERSAKMKSTFRDWLTLIAYGSVILLLFHAALALVALAIGYVVSLFTEIEWWFGALISYLVMRFITATVDAFGGLRSVRCPSCRRRIQTSRAIKCHECGGAAKLTAENANKLGQ